MSAADPAVLKSGAAGSEVASETLTRFDGLRLEVLKREVDEECRRQTEPVQDAETGIHLSKLSGKCRTWPSVGVP